MVVERVLEAMGPELMVESWMPAQKRELAYIESGSTLAPPPYNLK